LTRFRISAPEKPTVRNTSCRVKNIDTNSKLKINSLVLKKENLKCKGLSILFIHKKFGEHIMYCITHTSCMRPKNCEEKPLNFLSKREICKCKRFYFLWKKYQWIGDSLPCPVKISTQLYSRNQLRSSSTELPKQESASLI
jgi:hypothetical protein